jgi:gas vesicle protein
MADRDGSGFLWFLAGLSIGAAVGIIFAPKSGEEVRQSIREVAEETSGTIRERARQAREQAGDWGRERPGILEPAEGTGPLSVRSWTPGLSRC